MVDRSKPQIFLYRIAFFATLFALVVIGLGAFTRLVDAGLGCPDWPGCYGQLTIPIGNDAIQLANIRYPQTPLVVYKAMAEMIHRYFVGILSVFIVLIVGSIFFSRDLRKTKNIILSLCLIALLVYQILLGQWTVTLKLLPIIVTQHLLGGFLILSSLWILYLTNKPTSLRGAEGDEAISSNNLYLILTAFAGLILLTQIFLGAWTSTNYASLSCTDFPFCMNDHNLKFDLQSAFNFFSPVGINYDGGVLAQPIRQTIQMVHRFGALIVALYIFALSAILFLRYKIATIQKNIYFMMTLLLTQIVLGISNVIFKLPLFTALFHNLVAALLLLSIIKLFIDIKRFGADNQAMQYE